MKLNLQAVTKEEQKVKAYFSILSPRRKRWASIAEKGRKKAADCSFLVTDFDLV